jgi:hypothetical protein
MKPLEQIGIHDIKEHIIRNWMTHDGMWFYHCLEAHGIEEANRLNKAAIRTLAAIEIRRAIDLFGIDAGRINTFEGMKETVDAAFSVSCGEFMGFSYTFPMHNVLRWEFADKACFAYRGMQRMHVIDRYECGVLYRVLCWLDHAGIRYEVPREIKHCLMHECGSCAGEIRFLFPETGV